MKKQNSLGTVLFFIGCSLIVGFTEYSHSSSAAYFGKTVAHTAVFSLLILIVLLVTPYRKKIAIGVVIGSIWFASSIYSSVALYKLGAESKELAKDAVQLIDSFTENEKIRHSTNNSDGQFTFIQLMQNYMVNIQGISQAYATELNDANLVGILSPDNLVKGKNLKISKDKLSALLSNTPKYEEQLLEELLNFEEMLSARKDKDSVDALNGFQKTKEDGILLLKAYYKNQINIISVVNEIVNQADRLLGKLSVKNGQLIFPTQEELNRYNQSLEKINKLSEDEQKIIEYQQGKIKASTEELRKLI